MRRGGNVTPTALTLSGLRTQPVSFYLAAAVLWFGCSWSFIWQAKARIIAAPVCVSCNTVIVFFLLKNKHTHTQWFEYSGVVSLKGYRQLYLTIGHLGKSFLQGKEKDPEDDFCLKQWKRKRHKIFSVCGLSLRIAKLFDINGPQWLGGSGQWDPTVVVWSLMWLYVFSKIINVLIFKIFFSPYSGLSAVVFVSALHYPEIIY